MGEGILLSIGWLRGLQQAGGVHSQGELQTDRAGEDAGETQLHVQQKSDPPGGEDREDQGAELEEEAAGSAWLGTGTGDTCKRDQ